MTTRLWISFLSEEPPAIFLTRFAKWHHNKARQKYLDAAQALIDLWVIRWWQVPQNVIYAAMWRFSPGWYSFRDWIFHQTDRFQDPPMTKVIWEITDH